MTTSPGTAPRTPALRLEPVTPDTFDAACALSVRPDQAHLVAPVVKSLAEAYVHGATAWPRAVVDGDEVVGFVMAFLDIAWNPAEDPRDIRSGLWRLNISAAHQSKGYGRFAVEAVTTELRTRGASHAYVTYHLGPGTPEPFYLALGFRPTGETSDGETVAVLDLTAP
ncbi:MULTISPECIES: GNAT family N-acetyltransferase [unclassified Streptomyces]|uniref:GNAT family N-acetyltransferase n=1 Tax=unclassified Streptomyces TaxID=2593676 RepID=UPI000DC79EC1|nr:MULTISPECIES: GNAT family N-acetyltransferase [unclassified Streptomyces]AWZ09787.1 GNAT family N-acetyltransferase [Streptomyces sp. ICC4]AWZ17062.1 GNAT family N-acetyltransferase [Streptomyces sp. ICC1]